MMAYAVLLTQKLEMFLHGWKFMGIDANGRLGGLAIGWHSHFVKILNSWALASYISVDILEEGVGLEFRVLNVYGPYIERDTFWDSLLKIDFLMVDNLILGGELNFSLGRPNFGAQIPALITNILFFTHILSTNGILDISPWKLLPTWRNMQTEDSWVEKWLDRFLVSKILVKKKKREKNLFKLKKKLKKKKKLKNNQNSIKYLKKNI
jgi:hypothetical protein